MGHEAVRIGGHGLIPVHVESVVLLAGFIRPLVLLIPSVSELVGDGSMPGFSAMFGYGGCGGNSGFGFTGGGGGGGRLPF